MFQIIDKSGNGKTNKLMSLTKENNGILVCSNPEAMKVKANTYGFSNINIISYFDYINYFQKTDKEIFIDEIDNFINQIYPSITGYSLTIGD